MLKNIDRKSLQMLRPLIEKELETLAKKHGIIIKVGNGSFDMTHLNGQLKVEISVVGEGGMVMNREATDFLNNAELLGMKKEWLNKEFTNGNGNKFKIIGLRLRARMNVVCTKIEGGGTYVFQHDAIIRKISEVTNA